MLSDPGQMQMAGVISAMMSGAGGGANSYPNTVNQNLLKTKFAFELRFPNFLKSSGGFNRTAKDFLSYNNQVTFTYHLF